LGLGLTCALWFLACAGTGRSLDGDWRGTAKDAESGRTFSLRLKVREDGGEPNVKIRLDGETDDAYGVNARHNESLRFLYDLPSGRRGSVGAEMNDDGDRLRGTLRVEEGAVTFTAGFRLIREDDRNDIEIRPVESPKETAVPAVAERLLHEEFGPEARERWAAFTAGPRDPAGLASPALCESGEAAGSLVLHPGVPVEWRSTLPGRPALDFVLRLRPPVEGSVAFLLLGADLSRTEPAVAVRIQGGTVPRLEVFDGDDWVEVAGCLPAARDGWTRLAFTLRAEGRLEFPVPEGAPFAVDLPEAPPFPLALRFEGGADALVDEVLVTGP